MDSILSPEQVEDRKHRLNQASILLGTRIKDMINEVEQTYQIRFTFGLERTPFETRAAFLPTDLKDYGKSTT